MASRANKGITEEQKAAMCVMRRGGATQWEIAAAFNLSQVRVSQILRQLRKLREVRGGN